MAALRRRALCFVTALSLALSAEVTHAGAEPAKPLEHMLGMVDGLYQACTYEGTDQSEIEYHFGNCVGFIRGVRVTYEVQAMEHKGHFICPPNDIQNVQLRDAVVAEIESGKWKADDYSVYPIVKALKKAYPCSK